MLEAALVWVSALNLPADGQIVVDYFLKSLNTPFWHWLLRGLFALGLIICLAVYFYYRSDETNSSED